MTTIEIVSKETHQVLDQTQASIVSVNQPSVVVVHVNHDEVEETIREGNNVIVILKSGQKIIVQKFFNQEDYDTENSLVFLDDQNQLYWVQFKDAQGVLYEKMFVQTIDHIEPLLYHKAAFWGWNTVYVPVVAAGILAWSRRSKGDGNDLEKTIPTKPSTPVGIVDDQGGIQGTVQSGKSTDDPTPSINIGPLASGEKPNLYVNGHLVASDYDPVTGLLTPTTPLVDGTYQLSYSLSNDIGEGVQTDPITITIDTIAPIQPYIATQIIDNTGADQGQFLIHKPTDDKTPSLVIGPLEEGHTGNLYVDGQLVPSTYDPITGSLTPTVELTEGSHQIAYSISDSAGNESPVSNSVEITIDLTPPPQPTVPTGFLDNAGLNQGNLSFNGPTDDSTPSLVIGPLDEWHTAQLYVNGEKVAATYDPDSKTLTPVLPLPQGEHSLTYTISDAAGNISAQSPEVKLIIDTTAPDKPANPAGFYDDEGGITGPLAHGAVTDDKTPALRIGPIEDGLEPVLYINGERVDSTYDPNTGLLTPINDLGDGVYQIHYTVADEAGNESQPTSTIRITVFTDSPAKPVTPTKIIDNHGDQQGEFIPSKPTDDNTPSLVIGPLNQGETATLYINNQKVDAIYSPLTNTLTPITPLPEGTHTLRFTITNVAGIESVPSNPLTVIIDTTPPPSPAQPYGLIDNVGPEQGTQSILLATDDNKPGIIIAPIAMSETANLYVNGNKVEAILDRQNNTLTPVQPLPDGVVSIQISTTDAAGNESELTTAFTLNVDTIAPPKPALPSGILDNQGTNTGVVGDGSTIDDKTPSLIIGQIDNELIATLYVDGQPVEAVLDRHTGILSPVEPLGDGTHQLSYTLSDRAGNESTPSDVMTVTVNTNSPPQPDLPTSLIDNEGEKTGSQSSHTPTDDTTPSIVIGPLNQGETATLYINNQKVDAIYNPNDGTLTPQDELPEGTYNIRYTITNVAGNESVLSPPLSVVIDHTAPEKPVIPSERMDDEGHKQPLTNATNDTTPSIVIGPLATGETPILYINGNPVPATYNRDDGTLTPVTQLPEGSYTIRYAIEDAAGNVSSPSDPITLQVDLTAPNQPTAPTALKDEDGQLRALNVPTSDTTPSVVIGTLAQGLTATLYINGNEVPATYDRQTGTLTALTPLTEGNYDISYSVTDVAGNKSEPSTPIEIAIDTTAPNQPSQPTGLIDADGEPRNLNVPTNDTQPKIVIGPLGAGETANLIINGNPVPSTYNPVDGTISPTTALPEGTHQITVTISDTAGNESEKSDPINIQIDLTAPTKPTKPSGLLNAEGDQISLTVPTNDTTPSLVVGPLGTGETATLYVNGNPVPADYDALTGTLTPVTGLPEGTHNITFSITDVAGNESEKSDVVTVEVDLTPPNQPTQPVGFVDEDGEARTINTPTNDVTPNIVIGPLAAGETPILYVDGVAVPSEYDEETGTLSPTTPLTEGQHEISFSVRDAAGNESTPSTPLEIEIDTTAPNQPSEPTGLIDADGEPRNLNVPTNDTTPSLVIGPLSNGDIAKLYVNGTEVAATYDPSTGTLTPTTALPEGTHSIGYTIQDRAGNESEKSDLINVEIDLTAPDKPVQPNSLVDDMGNAKAVDQPNNDSTPSLVIGPLSEGEKATLYVNGQPVDSVYNQVDGTLTPVRPLGEGTHELSFTISDVAGNESELSDPIEVSIDVTGPSKPPSLTHFVDDHGENKDSFTFGTVTDDNTPTLLIGQLAPGESVKLYVNDKEVPSIFNPNTGELTPVDGLPEGLVSLRYGIVDAAGNSSELSAPMTVYVDTIAPAKPEIPSTFKDDEGHKTGQFNATTVTDDDTPTLVIGPLSSGLTPRLYNNGELIPSDYNSTTGELTPQNPLANGTHALTYSLVDAAGNESEASDPIHIQINTSAIPKPNTPINFVDNEGEIKGALTVGSHTDDATPTLVVGPLPHGETAILYVDNQKVNAIYNAETGTLTPATALPEGTHQLSYSIVNAIGKESPQSNPIEITVDTLAPDQPAKPTGFMDTEGGETGPLEDGDTTDDRYPGLIIGPIGADETPHLYVNGEKIPSTYDPITGILKPTDALGDGLQVMTFSLSDEAGNESPHSEAVQLTVETGSIAKPSAPSGFIDNHGDLKGNFDINKPTDDNTPSIVIGPLANGETATLYVNNVEVPAIYNAQQGTLTPVDELPEGTNSIRYTITNNVGVESVPSTAVNITVDTIAPDKPAAPTQIKDNVGRDRGTQSIDTPTDDSTPGIVIGPLADGERAHLYINGDEFPSSYDENTGLLTPSVAIGEGVFNISYSISDAAGNKSERSDEVQVTIDLTAPDQPVTPIGIIDDHGGLVGTVNPNQPTDDKTPSLNIGLMFTGERPQLYVDGIPVDAIYDENTGRLTPVDGLTDGEHALSYSVIDEAGNESTPSNALTVLIDTQAPPIPNAPTAIVDDEGSVTGQNQLDKPTDDTTPSFIIGPLAAGEKVALYVDNLKVDAQYDPVTGTITPDIPLTEGSHTIRYSIQDAAGNESQLSHPVTVTIDLTPPDQPSEISGYIDNVGLIQGHKNLDQPTDDAKPSFVIGPLATGSTATLIVDNVPVAAVYDPITKTLTPETALTEGPHAIRYVIQDEAGNVSEQSDPINITIDLTAPAQPANATGFVDNTGSETGTLSEGATTDDTTPGLLIGPIAPGLSVNLYVDGKLVPSKYDPYTGIVTPIHGIEDGQHAIHYTVSDKAGNESTASDPFNLIIETDAPPKPATPQFIIDETGPKQGQLSIQQPTDDTRPSIVIGPLNAGETATLYVNNQKVDAEYDSTTQSLRPVKELPEGANSIQYTITDSDAKVSVPSTPVTVTVDTIAPTKPQLPSGKIDDEGPEQGQQLLYSITDDATPSIVIGPLAEGETPNFILNGTKVPAVYDPLTGVITPVSALPEGENRVQISISDAAGNESPASDAFTLHIDTTPPVKPNAPTGFYDDVGSQKGLLSSNQITDDTKPSFVIGPLAAGEKAILYVNNNIVDATYDPATQTLTPVHALPQGISNIQLSIRDAAGNESDLSDPIQIAVDSIAPNKPSTPQFIIDEVGQQSGQLSSSLPTDDTTPGIVIGPLANGEKAELYINGEKVESYYDQTTGALSPVDPLEEGTHNIRVSVTDAAGNQSPLSDPIQLIITTSAPPKPVTPTGYLDDVGNNMGVMPFDQETDDGMPGIVIGGLADGNTANLYVNGQKVAATYNAATETLTPDAPLPEGYSSITYSITNAVGIEGARSDPITIFVDTVAPSKPDAPTQIIDDIGNNKGTLAIDLATDDTRPSIVIGPLAEGETATLYINDEAVDAEYDEATGTLTPVDALPQGVYSLQVSISDALGNTSELSDPISLTVDLVAPNKPSTPTKIIDDIGGNKGEFDVTIATDDTQPSFVIGTIGDDEIANLYVNGTKVDATYDSVTGTLTPITALTNGTHNIRVSLSDEAGNESPLSDVIQLTVATTQPDKPNQPTEFHDNVGSVTGLQSFSKPTDDAKPSIVVGPLLAGQTVNLYVNNQKVSASYDSVMGTVTPLEDLQEGNNSIQLSISNAIGVESPLSDAVLINVDRIKPDTPESPDSFYDDIGNKQGTLAIATETDDQKPGFVVGELAAGETAKLYINGQPVNAVYDEATGTLTPIQELVAGTYSVQVSIVDAAGNESDLSPTVSITIDLTPPNKPNAPTGFIDDNGVTPVQKQPNAMTNDTKPSIVIGPLLNGETATLYVNGEKVDALYDVNNGTLTPITALTDGDNLFSYSLSDVAGNESQQSNQMLVKIDTVPPAKPDVAVTIFDNYGDIKGPLAPGETTDDRQPTLVIENLPEGFKANLYVNGDLVDSTYDPLTGHLSPVDDLPEGEYSMSYTVVDLAGNESEQSDGTAVVLDTTAPDKPSPLTGFFDDVGDDQGLLLDGSETDDLQPEFVIGSIPADHKAHLYVNGIRVESTYDENTGRIKPVKPLGNGTFQITYTISDPVGNQSVESDPFEIIVETGAPPQPAAPTGFYDDIGIKTGVMNSGNSTDDSRPEIVIGPIGDGEIVTLYINGDPVSATIDPITGRLVLDDDLPEGSYQISYTITNDVGNESVPSEPLELTIDKTAPNQPNAPTSYFDNEGSQSGLFNLNIPTDDTRPSIMIGPLASGEVANLYLNNSKINATYDPVTGRLTPDQDLGEGINNLTWSISDAAGNESLKSAPFSINIDTTAPDASKVIAITRISDDLGVSNTDFITSDTSLTIHGTVSQVLAADERAQISINGGVTWTNLAVTNGNWEYEDARTLVAQSYNYMVRIVDLAGNLGSTENKTVIIDTSQPNANTVIKIVSISSDTGMSNSDFITNDTSLTVHGTLSQALAANERAQISLDSGTTWTNLTVANGQWSFEDTRTLTSQDYTYQVRVTNLAGNVGSTDDKVVSVITTGPDQNKLIAVTSISSDNGLSSSDFITNDTSLTIHGSVSQPLTANEHAQISIDGGTTWTNVTVTNNLWSYTDTRTLISQDYQYLVRVVDLAGNVGHSASRVVTVDTSTPNSNKVIEITSISDDRGYDTTDFITNDTSITVNGTLSQLLNNNERAEISLDSGLTWQNLNITNGQWSYQDNRILNSQDYTYMVRVVTVAGNVGSTDTQVVRIDTTGPNPDAIIAISHISTDTGESATDFITSDTSLTIHGSVAQPLATDERAQISVNGGTTWQTLVVNNGQWSYEDSRTLSTQDYNYMVRVIDNAGNVGSTSNRTVTVDTTAPSLSKTIAVTSITQDSGLSTTDFVTNQTSITINGTVSQALAANERAQISIDDGQTWTNVSVINGIWNYADSRTLTDGHYTYLTRIVNVAGQVGSTSSKEVVIDTIAPDSTNVIAITSISDDRGFSSTDFITNDTSLIINGTLAEILEDGEVAQISINGGNTWTNLTVNNGVWNYTDTRILTSQIYNYMVRVIDLAGNVGSQASQSVTIDTAGPNKTTSIQSYTDDIGAIIGNYSSGTTTDDENPVLNGTISAALSNDERVAIYMTRSGNTTFVGYAVVNGLNWNYEIPDNLLQDTTTYVFNARVQDLAGNLASNSNNMQITLNKSILVSYQFTLDTTPIIKGSTGYALLPGEYLEVRINNVTYSSLNGDVVIDTLNKTWYVEIPNNRALAKGSVHNVQVFHKDAQGTTLRTDGTNNEITIGNDARATLPPDPPDGGYKPTAYTMHKGQFLMYINGSVLTQVATSTTNAFDFTSNLLKNTNTLAAGAATFIDFDRDGDMDIFAVDNDYRDGQQAFENMNSNLTYMTKGKTTWNAADVNVGWYGFQVGTTYAGWNTFGDYTNTNVASAFSGNVWTINGGIVAFDKFGDGYVDMVVGDSWLTDGTNGMGVESSFVMNDRLQAALDSQYYAYFYKDHAYSSKDSITNANLLANLTGVAANTAQDQLGTKLAVADLDGNGTVDVVGSGSGPVGAVNYTISGYSTFASPINTETLIVVKNQGNGRLNTTQILTGAVGVSTADYSNSSLTFADFDGDGDFDLFNTQKGIIENVNGQLAGGSRDSSTGAQSASVDWINGLQTSHRGSIAVDWNADGKMDLITLSGVGASTKVVTYFRNDTTIAGYFNFQSGVNWTSGFTLNKGVWSSGATRDSGVGFSGVVVADFDFDGDRDFMAFTTNAGSYLVENKDANFSGANQGVIHLRILDQEGINALMGNTVMLYDENGNFIASQMINTQSGNQTNDSTGLVSFYGLDKSKSYNAMLLRNIGGHEAHIAAMDLGGKNITTINTAWTNGVNLPYANGSTPRTGLGGLNQAWGNLKTGNPWDAYILTAENGSATFNANKGDGIIGTGYNDTFFATLGTDKYDGAGGSHVSSGVRNWHSTAGMDIVDYKLAGNAILNINLTLTGQQNTGFGMATFKNIEGISGAAGDDVLTGNIQDNYFEGRGGNDIFNIQAGGQDVLMYKLIEQSDATGGNGSDIVNGFRVGITKATPNADIINIKELLIGYVADANGPAHYVNGVATLDSGETIEQFLRVVIDGSNTILEIDRDGAANAYNFTTLLTITNVNVDLVTLLANEQIIIG